LKSNNRAVFLDRDGVLNAAIVREGKPYPPANIDELIIPSDVLSALTMLKKAGFMLIVVTNQPDVARGKTTQESVDIIHQHLCEHLPLDVIRVCAHDDRDNCDCRKPLPGLLIQAAQDYNIELEQSYMIGDRWRDIEAGQAAGCVSIFLDYGYLEKRPEAPDYIAQSLQQAAEWINK
jgi:D-glycero-D-manno-heptose 1,7-bisphosphate phosphatase